MWHLLSVHERFILFLLILHTHCCTSSTACMVESQWHSGCSFDLTSNIELSARTLVSLLYWHSAYCPPEYCHADSRQQGSWNGRRKVRYSTDHRGHQVYLETLSKATGRYAEGSVLTDCVDAVNCRNWGKPQNSEGISRRKFETRTTKHISELNRLRRPKCPKGNEENHGNIMQDNRILRIRSKIFSGDITDIFFVKILKLIFCGNDAM